MRRSFARFGLLLCGSIFASPPAIAAAPAAGPCALHVAAVVPVDEKVYAIILRSGASVSDVHVNLYSDDDDYAVSIPQVHFQPAGSPLPASAAPLAAGLESAPIFVALPKAEIINAARAELADSSSHGDRACFPPYAYTDSYQRLSNPIYAPSAEARALKLALVHEYARGAPAINAVAIDRSSMGQNCPIMTRQARITKFVAPNVPDFVAFSGFRGSAQVFVRLDPSGKVIETGIYKTSGNAAFDSAVRRAAEASGYEPEIFRCDLVPSTYLYQADFNR